jgi:hypothetical protein
MAQPIFNTVMHNFGTKPKSDKAQSNKYSKNEYQPVPTRCLHTQLSTKKPINQLFFYLNNSMA